MYNVCVVDEILRKRLSFFEIAALQLSVSSPDSILGPQSIAFRNLLNSSLTLATATQRCLSCQQGSKFISKDQSLLPLYTILNQSEGNGTDRKNQDLNKFHPAFIMLCLLFSKGQDLQYLQPPPPLDYSCPWLFSAPCLWSKFHNECRSDKCLVRLGFFSVPPQHHQLSMAFFLPQTSFMCY